MNYKVGDRVVCKGNYHNKDIAGKVGTVKVVDSTIVGVEFDKHISGHSCGGRCKRGHGWWVHKSLLKAISNHKIVITTDGKTTLARLYEGDKVVKSAQAICSPDDEFDFGYGARLAFDRLMDKPEFKPHLRFAGENYGVVGEETKYKDVVGRKLCVGDVVELFDECGMSYGNKFVVRSSAGLNENKSFIMGIEVDCNEKTGKISYGWKIFKTRGYETLKHGEVIGDIEYKGEVK
jgi:hypothetical protein